MRYYENRTARDSLVGYGAMCGFIRLDAMSRSVSCPWLASRPFDADRDGFVMPEGAGFVVLQRLEEVPASGPEPLGLILGQASSVGNPGGSTSSSTAEFAGSGLADRGRPRAGAGLGGRQAVSVDHSV